MARFCDGFKVIACEVLIRWWPQFFFWSISMLMGSKKPLFQVALSLSITDAARAPACSKFLGFFGDGCLALKMTIGCYVTDG